MRHRRRRAPALTVIVLCSVASLADATQAPSNPAEGLTSGESIYHAGCAGCHGPHGEGMPDTTVGFDKPDTFPDFSACDQTTPELDADWKAVIHEGGRARGFSRIMPAFGELLTPIQIDAVVAYMRGFCRNAAWPRGELNLPRPLATEKAFPESEAVVTTAVGHNPSDVSNEFVYEHRIGSRNQIEISVPLDFVHDEAGSRVGGIGDIGLGFKRALFASLQSGSIFSVQGEVVAPTGNADKGLGTGTTVFEAVRSVRAAAPVQRLRPVAGRHRTARGHRRRGSGRVRPRRRGQELSSGGRPWPALVSDARTAGRPRIRARAKTNFDILLLYQPIGYRWAENLKRYASVPEPRRFNAYYDAMIGSGTATLARMRVTIAER